jgi:hypothetical protein
MPVAADGVGDRGGDRRHARLAESTRRRVRLDELRRNPRRILHVNHLEILEIALDHLPLRDGDLGKQRGRQTENDAAFDLRQRGVGIDDAAAIHGRINMSHAKLPVRRDGDVCDFRGDGAEALGNGDSRPSPSGSGWPQSAIAATRSSAARKRGCSLMRSRRN